MTKNGDEFLKRSRDRLAKFEPTGQPGGHNATPYEQALGLAREYRQAEEGAHAIELRNAINGLVGSFVDGKMVLPAAILRAMGE